MIEDLLGQPATHAAWSPFFDFDEGNFVEWVQIGKGCLDPKDGSGASMKMLQHSRVTSHDTGYICLLPIGEQPSEPPPAHVLESARYKAEQRRQGNDAA